MSKQKADGYVAKRVLTEIAGLSGESADKAWDAFAIALEIDHKGLTKLLTEIVRDASAAEKLAEMLRNSQYTEAETLIMQGKHR